MAKKKTMFVGRNLNGDYVFSDSKRNLLDSIWCQKSMGCNRCSDTNRDCGGTTEESLCAEEVELVLGPILKKGQYREIELTSKRAFDIPKKLLGGK